jgi:PKHD-type hydroxylase
MLIRIPNLLTADELAACRAKLAKASWTDGRTTAGLQSARVKENLQLPEDGADTRDLGQIVIRALERSPQFMAVALPRHVFPPSFNRYEPGMAYGAHDGGELVVEGVHGVQSAKFPAGDLIVYPATSLHRVAPVTRGARNAAFFWIQSMVKDDGERTLLFDIDRSIMELSQALPDNAAVVRLTACYHNLLRRWAEM